MENVAEKERRTWNNWFIVTCCNDNCYVSSECIEESEDMKIHVVR